MNKDVEKSLDIIEEDLKRYDNMRSFIQKKEKELYDILYDGLGFERFSIHSKENPTDEDIECMAQWGLLKEMESLIK